MNAREELAGLISDHHVWSGDEGCSGKEAAADAILAAGYSKPRTISTVEELEELPAASILIAGSRIYQKERGALMDLGIGLLGYEEVLEESGRLTLIFTPKES